MSNPIERAQALTPVWMKTLHEFDGLEIHPCRCEREDGRAFI